MSTKNSWFSEKNKDKSIVNSWTIIFALLMTSDQKKKCQQNICYLVKIFLFFSKMCGLIKDYYVSIWNPRKEIYQTLHTVSFDWFLSGIEWIINLEFCLVKLLIFYQKLFWNIRSRLNSSTFWVFRPVFGYVWSKLKLFAQKMKILIKHM